MQLALAVFQFVFILAASLYFYSILVLKTVHARYVGLAISYMSYFKIVLFNIIVVIQRLFKDIA